MLSEIFPITAGFVGSLHCLGMCGPLVLAYSFHIDKSLNADNAPGAAGRSALERLRRLPWLGGLIHHGAFHLGRILTYGFLGALAAALFQAVDMSSLFSGIRGKMVVLSGFLLILTGLVLLRVFPLPARLSALFASQGSFFSRTVPPLLKSRRPLSKLALGLLVGFMPCGMSWAMILAAATTQNPLHGLSTMVGFGLGTVPALVLTGLSASFISLRVRFLGERVAALMIVAMGLKMFLKGAGILG